MLLKQRRVIGPKGATALQCGGGSSPVDVVEESHRLLLGLLLGLLLLQLQLLLSLGLPQQGVDVLRLRVACFFAAVHRLAVVLRQPDTLGDPRILSLLLRCSAVGLLLLVPPLPVELLLPLQAILAQLISRLLDLLCPKQLWMCC